MASWPDAWKPDVIERSKRRFCAKLYFDETLTISVAGAARGTKKDIAHNVVPAETKPGRAQLAQTGTTARSYSEECGK